MPTSEEAQELIEFDPDYVYLRRYGFSAEKLLHRYPDGVPDHIIAQGLLVPVEEVERIYQGAVVKLRAHLRVEST